MSSAASDLRFGQLAVRMGMLPAQDLPRIMQEARAARDRARKGEKPQTLGQLLVRKKLVTMSEYLYLAREAEKPPAADPLAEQLEQAIQQVESGELPEKAFEALVSSAEMAIPKPAPTGAPPRFGRYELLEEVARGGMGIVYRAKDSKTEAIVALKVMIEADDDDARLARFESEAELARQLDHPGIVKVHDAGCIDSMPYFTMDLVEGKSLDDLLETGLDRRVAIGLLAQVARAAHYAHEKGIVHRDLKPGNILVDGKTGAARITDFGLARDMDRNTRITRVGQAVGTPYYMAPEQVRGERDVDGRSDTYALGVMLYEVLTGDIPFDADSALTLFKKIDREPVNLPLDPERGIDSRIRAIALRCLEKDRTERYATAQLLADDLERYLKATTPGGAGLGPLRPFLDRVGRRRRELVLGSAGVAIVLSLVLLVGAVASHVSNRRELEAGERDARARLERARGLLAKGEETLAERPATAEENARAARELLDEASRLASGEGPYPRGARRILEAEAAPDEARSWGLLGRALVALGKNDEAEDALARATHARADGRLLLLLARVRRARGSSRGALEALDEAIQLDRRDVAALVERGEVRLEEGSLDEAIGAISPVLREDSLTTDQKVRLLLARARAYLARSDKATGPDARTTDLQLASADAEAAA